MSAVAQSLVVFSPACLLVVCAAGCGGALIREVRRTPTGGEVAMLEEDDEASIEAQKLMRLRCPRGYAIVDEGEKVVGQVYYTDSYAIRPWGWHGGGVWVSGATHSSDQREWRVRYVCTQGQPASPPAAPAQKPASPPPATPGQPASPPAAPGVSL